MDVLDMLPLDVVRDNFWQVLQPKRTSGVPNQGLTMSPHAAHQFNWQGTTAGLLRSCRQARQLVDALTYTHTSTLPASSELPVPHFDAHRTQQCLVHLEGCAVHLQRLRQLSSLILNQWDDAAFRSNALPQVGQPQRGACGTCRSRTRQAVGCCPLRQFC